MIFKSSINFSPRFSSVETPKKRATKARVLVTRAHIAVSAAGLVIPPFFIFEKLFPCGSYARLGPEKCIIRDVSKWIYGK